MVNGKRCDDCFFSVYLMAASRAVLGCKQKTNFVGRYRVVELDDKCGNFYPSTVSKLGKVAVRRVPLTRGKFAVVDAEDYYRLIRYRWHAVFNSKTFYAARIKAGKTIKMHREITGAPGHLVVDHIDRDGLNNCRGNLRVCSAVQNFRNTGSTAGASSKYKGVHWHKKKNKWAAAIQYNKKVYHLGYFEDQVDAAKAYDIKAGEYFGEFAYLNFPPAVERKLKV